MNFILALAWRDSRRSRRRLVLCALSIVLGVAALVAIGSFGDNLRAGLDNETKALLGADLSMATREPLPAEAAKYLSTLGGARAKEVDLNLSMITFPKAGGAPRLVSVRGVEPGFPFYGDFITEPAGGTALLAGDDAAIVEETVLRQYGAKVGDPIKVGSRTFTIAGTLQQIPGESAAVALLAPRVYLAYTALPSTGLLTGAGSLANYKTYFQFPPTRDVSALVTELKARFSALRINYETVETRKQELDEVLGSIQSFLSLVGFIALFLGAIGVASAIHVYVRQKISTVAVLRCLGASGRQAFAVYLVQGLAVGAAGAIAGAILGVGVQLALPTLARSILPFDTAFFISWPAVARGLVAGLVICGLFALLPLLAVRRVPPLAALRADVAGEAHRPDPWRIAVYLAIAAAVAGFAIWQTGKWRVGFGFTGALAVCLGTLTLLARLVSALARRYRPQRLPYVARQGVANLHRPNNRTVLLLVSLGLGTFLLLTLSLTRTTLLADLRHSGGEGQPNLMLIDIQDNQVAPLAQMAADEGVPLLATAPVVTMKISQINGRTVDDLMHDSTPGVNHGMLRREYRSTYRDALNASEKLTAGKYTGHVAPGTKLVPVSVEAGLAGELQLKVGDELVFDVQGVPLAARVDSLRTVEWRQLTPNFFFLFPTGVLEPAPKYWLAAAHANSSTDSVRLQSAVVAAFPNVTAIDLSLVMQTLDSIFHKLELVIQFMALFTVVTGLVVLAGAVLGGRHQRMRETVLLRTLGATRRQLRLIELVEYTALGALAATAGGGMAYGANALLAHWVFTVPVVAPVGLLGGAVLVVTVLTLLTGLLAGRGVLNHPPLEVLRQEG